MEHKIANENLESYLENIVVKVCVLRLVIFIVLSLPATIINIDNFSIKNLLYTFIVDKYLLGFIVSGLCITLLFIISWRFFKNVLLFFRLQLITDIILSSYFILITGGISSNGTFLLLAILFLYGRILGKKTSIYTFFIILFILISITLLQLNNLAIFHLTPINKSLAFYYLSLQISALCLIGLLIRMGESRENILLREIATQQRAVESANILKTKVFDWINSGILVLDNKGNIKSINKMGAKLLQIDPASVLTRPIKNVFSPFYTLWEKWDKQTPLRKEIKENNKVFGITLSPVPDNETSLMIFSDITLIKELEMRVVQMEKLAVIGEMAAGLAHEIKNPLSGIKGSIQLLMGGNITEKQKKTLTDIIFRDINRLDNLLKDFLYFARPKEPEKKEIDLEKLFDEIVFQLKTTHKDIEFILCPSIKGKRLIWDQSQLKQVILNLILNSIQSMEHRDEKKVVMGIGKDNKGRKLIFIQDTGEGIDRDIYPHVFDPFFTTKTQGTGLGLSIAQRLCSQNNSWIELKNRKTGGLIAKIYVSSDN